MGVVVRFPDISDLSACLFTSADCTLDDNDVDFFCNQKWVAWLPTLLFALDGNIFVISINTTNSFHATHSRSIAILGQSGLDASNCFLRIISQYSLLLG